MGANLKKVDLENIIKNNFPYQTFSFDLVPDTFSSTEYITPSCGSHGNFSILPYRFKKIGCPKCRWSRLGNNKKVSIEDFTTRANIVHSNFYEYSKVKFEKISDIGLIICPIHGEFNQKLSNHLSGQGCPVCGKRKAVDQLRTKLEVLFNFEIFSNYRLLSKKKESYVDTDKLIFECSLHGTFEKTVHNIKLNQGCPKCKSSDIGLSRRYSELEFLNLITLSPGVEYVSGSFTRVIDPVKFKCSTHGSFEINKGYYGIQNTVICPACNTSSLEAEVLFYLNSIGVKYLLHYRPEWLDGKEIDIFIPELNVGIEINGSYWHSDKFKDKWYHFEKWDLCNQNNIRLLNIWEHYWKIDIRKKIYKSKIKHLLKMDEKIFARKCSIEKIESHSAKLFHIENHLEGFSIPYKDSFSIGLSYNDVVYMVATVGQFFNQNRNCFEWKLQRLSTRNNYTVVAGVSRIVSHLKKEIGNFTFQVTLDTGGSLLSRYDYINHIDLRYWWVNGSGKFKTRNECQVSRLRLNEDWLESDTEKSYMERNNWFRVWDTGICTLDL